MDRTRNATRPDEQPETGGRDTPCASCASALSYPICLTGVVWLLASHLWCPGAPAVELWSDEQGRRGALDVTGKITSLSSDPPADPFLFPDDFSQTLLARLRLGLDIRHSDFLDSQWAYEQRARWSSAGTALAATGSFLPAEARAPFRLTQLDGEICGHEDDFAYRHEIDRAFVALHPEWGEITAGRQAIGLGRGVLFSAVDLFAPFSPLEVDREWRRGVDAVRAEYRLSPTSSAELIGVFGDAWERSAVLGRLRGYLGDIDGSLIFGKRAEDNLLGGVVSMTLGEAEVHAELAVFDTPRAQPDGTLWLGDDVVTKAVLGGSYTFDVGDGLTVLAEYHYSGFGVENAEDVLDRLQDPDFLRRFLRGDTQILGRQALAGQLSYPFTDTLNGTFLILTNPTDGSGILSPTLQLDLRDNVTLIGSLFLPWGAEPRAGQLRSIYGATPVSFFLQASVYY
jgi:hypothetical protein